jgi:hypothetical protein
MTAPQQLVQKLWNYCNILRDDGLSYGDYVEQLTFLLFLKIADEQSRPPFNPPSPDGLRRAGKPWIDELAYGSLTSSRQGSFGLTGLTGHT